MDILSLLKQALELHQKKHFGEALKIIDKCIELNKNYPEAFNLKAIILLSLNDEEKAIENWERAINIKKDYAEAYFNFANFYNTKNNFELSLKNYNKALEINNKYYLALLNRANLLLKHQRYKAALIDFNFLIIKYPQNALLQYNKASALDFLGQKKLAIQSLNKAIDLEPKFAASYFLRGIINWVLNFHKEALIDLEKGYSLNNDSYFLNSLIVFKTTLCDWKNIKFYQKKLIASINSGEATEFPLFIQNFEDSPDLELKASIIFNNNFKLSNRLIQKKKKEKIRLGYYSADFRNHATTHLIARLFELHDKNNFEIFAFSFYPHNNEDLWQKRIVKSCDRFIDVHKKTNDEISTLSKNLEIDIAIDLMGFANNNRYNIFARKCAPVQINYLGYPGTCGPNIMDYIIADRTLINQRNKKFFSEKVVFLPDTYQPNDDKKEIAKSKISRKDFNLPDDKFIFCSFNKTYKITPKMLNIWSEILKKKENSILLLLADNNLTKKNLKKEFLNLGVGSEKIIFTNLIEHSKHLARHKLVDLFIDTFPCTGHTTVSDALWAGLPVVTKVGNSFASRVSASLLSALNMSELITKNDDDYKKLILDLSNDRNKLLKIKNKIIKNIFKEPLFNSKLYTKNIEKSYNKIYENYLNNKKEDIEI